MVLIALGGDRYCRATTT